jgi:hypothetical protein
MKKSKLAHQDSNPQGSDAADPSYRIVRAPFCLIVRGLYQPKTALSLKYPAFHAILWLRPRRRKCLLQ